MTWINRTDVDFWIFSSVFRTGIKCEKQAKIEFLWCLNCFFEFFVFLVSVLNDKNVSNLLIIVFKVNFCHLIPIPKIQKIQKSNFIIIKSLNYHKNLNDLVEIQAPVSLYKILSKNLLLSCKSSVLTVSHLLKNYKIPLCSWNFRNSDLFFKFSHFAHFLAYVIYDVFIKDFFSQKFNLFLIRNFFLTKSYLTGYV